MEKQKDFCNILSHVLFFSGDTAFTNFFTLKIIFTFSTIIGFYQDYFRNIIITLEDHLIQLAFSYFKKQNWSYFSSG